VNALNDHLDELANEAQNVDLRDRVHAASHRVTLRRRRIVVASAAVVAVIAIASGVAVAGLPSARRDHGTPVGVDPTRPTTPAPPAPSMTPPDQTRTEAPVAWNELPATLYYQVTHPTDDGLRYELRWWAGKENEVQFTPPGLACGMFLSPDQSQVAWVAVSTDPGATGDLYVAGIDGNLQRRLLFDVTCTGLDVPVWLDSQTLIVGQGDKGPHKLIDVQTGKAVDSPFPEGSPDLVSSPNAQYAAYSADGKIVVCRPDGTVIRRTAHGAETPTGGFTVQGISDDGRRVVLGMMPSDPSHVRTGFRLVDTVTGDNLKLPKRVRVGNLTSAEIHPVPGNQLLVRVDEGTRHKIYLLGADGAILDTRTEPGTLHDALLLIRTDE
jgi:hypothetical protein